MMKKLLTAAALVISIGAANAQHFNGAPRRTMPAGSSYAAFKSGSNRTATVANSNDTLWYFADKHMFIEGGGSWNFWPLTTAGTSTLDINEIGSSFLNTTSLTTTGAMIWAGAYTGSNIPAKAYLYNANTTGAPTTKIDSASFTISSPSGFLAMFPVTWTQPRTLTGSFFVSYKAISTTAGDTIAGAMTTAATATAGSSWLASEKHGEGLSYSRLVSNGQSQLFVNTDFYFTGSDFEAVVAPIVSFSVTSNFTASAPSATATPAGSYCTNQSIGFTNTSAPSALYNRQFNFNQFIPYWQTSPRPGFVTAPSPADPINNWIFSNNSAVTVTTTNATNTLTTAGVFTTSLTVLYRPSAFLVANQKVSIMDVKTATYNVVACTTTTTVGINEIAGFENFSVYPNPTVNGKTTLSGLNGTNTILVYNTLGQLVSTQVTEKETVSVDLLNQSNGSYIVKIVNAGNHVKVVKIINQN